MCSVFTLFSVGGIVLTGELYYLEAGGPGWGIFAFYMKDNNDISNSVRRQLLLLTQDCIRHFVARSHTPPRLHSDISDDAEDEYVCVCGMGEN